MKVIKGFATIDALIDNSEGLVSPFGELSASAISYSRDRCIYSHNDGTQYHSFFSKDSTTGNFFAQPAGVVDKIIAVANYIATEHLAGNIPTNPSKASFLTTLAAVPAFAAYTGFEIGELLAGSSVTANMPDYVRFSFTDTGENCTVTLWFADASFRAQYDEYEIIVVPPHSPIDELIDDTAMVAPLLASFNATAALDAIQAAMNGIPATKSKIQTYTWHNPSAPTSTLSASFGIVIYGIAGDNTDNIKEAIKTYIADNSVETDWPIIFPDLYAENEFVFMPRWDKEADAGSALLYPIYAPVERVSQTKTDMLALVPVDYGATVTIGTYLDLHLEVVASYFRSLNMLVLGSPNNTGGINRFSQRFPDYSAMPASTTDFNRMSAGTRDFVLKLVEALEIARTMTGISAIPAGFNREVRDGNHYVSFEVAGDPYTYLVISKFSYDTVIV